MSSFRRFGMVIRGILLFLLLSGIVASTSLLIQDVFAYTGTQPISPQTPIGWFGNDELPYLPEFESSFAPKRVIVIVINEPIEGITYGKTVRDALVDFGIQYQQDFIVKPGLYSPVTDGSIIKINVFSKNRTVAIESIPYTTVSYLDDTQEIDTTTVVQVGVEGKKKVVYESSYIDGILQTKSPVSEEIISPSQNEIVAVGTMKVFRPMTIGIDSFMYWKSIRVFATSYDANCEGCNEWTATGARLEKGICAVDPKVIPLHSRFYVPGYGFCAAEDVGGAVKGNKIDLGFADLRNHQGEWSARYVDIYLLD